MEIFAIIILSIGLLSVLTYTLALPARHIMRNIRGRSIGELEWYQIKPESLISGRARSTPGEQTTAVNRFMNGLQGRSWEFLTRGVASVVWKIDDDDLVRLYIGIDRIHHDSMQGGLHSLAKGMNCRAERCSIPDIPVRNPSFAFREVGTPARVTMEPESLGNVARELSTLGIRGAVIFTLEDMSPSESSRTERFLASSGVVSDSGFSHSGAQSNVMGASAIRASIAATSTNGDYKSSESLLKQAYGSIGTAATKANYQSPYTTYALYGGFHTGAYTLIVVGLIALGLPLFIGIPFAVVGLLSFAGTVSGIPIFGKKWVEDRLAKGEVVIPPYRRINYRSLHNGLTTMAGFKKYRAPSRSQVIPLYAAPMAQILSFPDGDATLNIAAEVVPQIGVPANMDLAGRRDYMFAGITGLGQPMGVLYSDIEHCIYFAGAPNSGKTNLLEMLYGQMARLTPEQCGLQITPIWIETKGSGSYDTYKAASVNPRTIFIDAHNPNSNYRLALEGRRLSEGASVQEVLANVRSLVDGFQFAYGQAIADSSREALDYSIRIAMLLTADEIQSLDIASEVNADKPNVIRLASLVLAENGFYNVGPQLLAMREEMETRKIKKPLDEREQYLSQAIGILSVYFDPKKDTTAKSAPPANKLSALGNLETLWTPDHRVDVQVSQLPGHFAPIILNMGPYIIGHHQDGEPAYSSTSKKDARMALLAFNHMLWKFEQAFCSGWQEQGKRVVLFSDEMKDIAVDSEDPGADNVVESIAKEGRSRGKSIWCGSQMPHQVPESVRHELFAFGTKGWFRLPNKDSAAMVVKQMPRDTYFVEENIQKLPVGLMVVGEWRLGANFASPFTMIVPLSSTWLRYLDHFGQDVDTAFRAYAEHELPQVKHNMSISMSM